MTAQKLPLSVLIVEDSPADASLIALELRNAGFEPQWKRVETERDFRACLEQKWDIICCDFTLPQFSSSRALDLLKESKLDIPFLIVSGTIGEDRAIESHKAGATDYVLKERLSRLGPVVTRAIREVQERTERKQIEAQFIESQKMEGLGQLAGGVAHDFNNILGVILGYSEMLMEALAPGSLPHKFAAEIQESAARATALTRQLLSFSRKQPMELVVLDLNQVVEDTEKMLRRLIGEDVELEIIPGKEIGFARADVGYIGQVLMNLAINARDAMPNGGKLTIVTSRVTLDEAYESAHAEVMPGDYGVISVTDTGNGMTEEVKSHLFQALFTTKPAGKGTGLGLVTCLNIVKQCGGHIRVESAVGKGTTFNVYFPQAEPPTPVSPDRPQKGPLPRGTQTLLLVEDDPAVGNLTNALLEARGYTVLRAGNGQEGLNIARKHQGEPISLVITDLVMPQMGGKIMAEWLKSTFPHIKVLFTSGYTEETIGDHGSLEPGSAFLPKPYSAADLTRKVQELLESPQT